MERIIRQSQQADQFLVQAAIGRDLREFCASLNVEFDAFARAVDLDPAIFSRFDAYISLNRLCRLMKAISVMAADDAFGLRYGAFYKPGGTGPYGLGLRSAATFGDMLKFYARYTGVVVQYETFDVRIQSETFSIEWSYSPLIVHQEQYADFSACVVLRVFSGFAGQPVVPLRGQLQRSRPDNANLYAQQFTQNIVYGAATNRLYFSSDLLHIENPAGNPSAFEYMSQQCEAIIDRLKQGKSVIAMVTDDLARHLGRESCSIAEVARRVGLSERTLQRRLEESGTDFTNIYDSTRNNASLKLLIESHEPLSQIAQRLGYASHSAYSRAVKRQHGLTPNQIRSAQKAFPFRTEND
jgi:AraC-like DNA-binding protein